MTDNAKKLAAVFKLLKDPVVQALMLEFRKANFVSSYIIERQIESDEELIKAWLYDKQQSLLHKL